MSDLVATTTAMAGSPCHHALKYRTLRALPLATVKAVATNSDMALVWLHWQHGCPILKVNTPDESVLI